MPFTYCANPQKITAGGSGVSKASRFTRGKGFGHREGKAGHSAYEEGKAGRFTYEEVPLSRRFSSFTHTCKKRIFAQL
jgi:hypothetical protein